MVDAYLAVTDGIGLTSRRTRARMVARLRAQGIMDHRVLAAMEAVPRHRFVDEALAGRAYEDAALPIGFGQTISQPWMVARMTEALLAGGTVGKVLEVGTGSAYQTAILARVVDQVCTVERLGPLYHLARQRLREQGIRNVLLRHGDGGQGWGEQKPFDAILLTAAVSWPLTGLFQELRPGGRLIMPVQEGNGQRLMRFHWDGVDGRPEDLGPCRFVPLLSGTV